ncbi:hypothetical protein IFM89_029722 [Coptis chinensis]|uniref:Uncharacterized protein n=1 Tax=Coptis chinensis TaxID=261450 RepID=A0A835GYR5_9MAGN|nr:hypothetical protein IFM89_029722 [Coptis chinensis]
MVRLKFFYAKVWKSLKYYEDLKSGILNIVHSQVHVILSRFDIGLLPRNKFPSELMVREVKKESTSVACSFMAVLLNKEY